jgi:hypothetical protein
MLEMTAMRDVVFVAITLYSPEPGFGRCWHPARLMRTGNYAGCKGTALQAGEEMRRWDHDVVRFLWLMAAIIVLPPYPRCAAARELVLLADVS